MRTVKIAWVSRHMPLPAQLAELRRIFGDYELIRISKTFRDAREVAREVKEKGCKYAVVVLPLAMVAKLVEDREVIWIHAEMRALHMCSKGESCPDFNVNTDVWIPLKGTEEGRHLRFVRFWRIKEVKLILEPLRVDKVKD